MDDNQLALFCLLSKHNKYESGGKTLLFHESKDMMNTFAATE